MNFQKCITFSVITRNINSESDYTDYCCNIDIHDNGCSINWVEQNVPTEEFFLNNLIPRYSSPCYVKGSGLLFINPIPSCNFFAQSPRIPSSSRRDFTGRVISDTFRIMGQGLTEIESLICQKWIIEIFFEKPLNFDLFYQEPIFINNKPNLNFKQIEVLIEKLKSLSKDSLQFSVDHKFISYKIIDLFPGELKEEIEADQKRKADEYEYDSFTKEILNKIDFLGGLNALQQGLNTLEQKCKRNNSTNLLIFMKGDKQDNNFTYFIDRNQKEILKIVQIRDYQPEKILIYWKCNFQDIKKIAEAAHSPTTIVCVS